MATQVNLSLVALQKPNEFFLCPFNLLSREGQVVDGFMNMAIHVDLEYVLVIIKINLYYIPVHANLTKILAS